MNNKSDLNTFNSIFQEYQPRFLLFAQSYLRNILVAEDVVMESFMYYWENRQQLSSSINIPAYILTTVKHKCLNYLQHLDVRAKVSEELTEHAEWKLYIQITTLEACDPQELFSSEVQALVEKTLASLPVQTALIFKMSRYENKSNKDIASELNLSTKAVEFHITKTLKKLRIVLKDYLVLLYFINLLK